MISRKNCSHRSLNLYLDDSSNRIGRSYEPFVIFHEAIRQACVGDDGRSHKRKGGAQERDAEWAELMGTTDSEVITKSSRRWPLFLGF